MNFANTILMCAIGFLLIFFSVYMYFINRKYASESMFIIGISFVMLSILFVFELYILGLCIFFLSFFISSLAYYNNVIKK